MRFPHSRLKPGETALRSQQTADDALQDAGPSAAPAAGQRRDPRLFHGDGHDVPPRPHRRRWLCDGTYRF